MPTNKAVIKASNLGKKYNGKAVVKGINFSVYAGECFGILGPNGAGKTTVVKMICTLSPLTSGTLTVSGLDVGTKPRLIKQQIGVVGQENNLDPELTVWENMLIFARFYGLRPPRIKEHLENLLHLMELSENHRTRVEVLSGGMKRRLAIARGLINNPSLLVLDEPTTGLDPHARHVTWQQLRQIQSRGITILLTTHYLEEASYLCDRLVIMDDGLILEEGSPRALILKHVGSKVLEIGLDESGRQWQEQLGGTLGTILKGHLRLGNVLYLYSDNGEILSQRAAKISAPSSYRLLRTATLEDVFLKLTGRGLEGTKRTDGQVPFLPDHNPKEEKHRYES